MPHIPEEIRHHICSFLSFRPKTKKDLVEALKESLSRNLQTRQVAKDKYGPIEEWDTSCIRDMSNLFFLFKEFNRDISRWNVSRVVNFQGMFQNCYKFNINLSDWNVELGEDFSHMFHGAQMFNRNLSKWKPRRARNMSYMFARTRFHSDLNVWINYVDMKIPMTNIFYGIRRTASPASQYRLTTPRYPSLYRRD